MLKILKRYNPLRDNLAKLRKQENGIVIGKTLLFSKGKRKFAHGADIMLPIGRVMQEIPGAEEGIASVKTLRFLNVTTHELEIYGAIDQKLLPSKNIRPNLVMNCVTKNGKTVYITAYPTEDPIIHHIDSGIILEEIDNVLNIIEKRNNYDVLIKIGALNTGRLYFYNNYFDLHIAIEILSVAVLRLKQHGILSDSKLLLSGIDNLMPPQQDDIAKGIALRFNIRRDRDRILRRGAIKTPIEISYYNKQKEIKTYATAYIVHSPTGQFEHLERQNYCNIQSNKPQILLEPPILS